ncbi:MAG: VIT1/CCC1 transporter family protein, partial [Spirochaetota bacterium]
LTRDPSAHSVDTMANKEEIRDWKAHLQAEREAVWLYDSMAGNEPNADLSGIYRRLADTERRHVAVYEGRLKTAGIAGTAFKPSLRTRLLRSMAKRNGASAVVPLVAAIEVKAAASFSASAIMDPEARAMQKEENSHARVFGWLSDSGKGVEGSDLARFEGRHRSGGNALRAGILGANDGLVSVFLLVMGVAGAGVPQKQLLLTGGAGLVAGALSMALGEWLSVQSARELYANQMAVEARELEELPEEEKEELALIYQAKGLDAESARTLADKLLSDKKTALDTLAREELGIDPDELGGNAWEAAGTSFLLFAAGGLLPIVPYLFLTGWQGIAASAALGTLGLFGLGATSSFLTGTRLLTSSLRQVLIGLAAAAVTFGIGRLVGAALG